MTLILLLFVERSGMLKPQEFVEVRPASLFLGIHNKPWRQSSGA